MSDFQVFRIDLLKQIKLFLWFIIILPFLVNPVYGGTISFSNFESRIEIQSNGTPVSTGFVSVGTTDATVFSDRQSVYQSFIQFGESTTIGGAAAFN